MPQRNLIVVAVVLFLLAPEAWAAGPRSFDGRVLHRHDDIKHPLAARRRELRRQALRQRAAGTPFSRVAGTPGGRFVELEQARLDRVFMLLVEFGEKEHAEFPGAPAGPLHNQIAEPDCETNNTTIWQADFDTAHYRDVLTQMDDYYGWQSSGRYGLDGDVMPWVKVKYNEARYGNNQCGDIVCPTVDELIPDALTQWVHAQRAAGMSMQQIHDYLATFDMWDRDDYDGDGNFDEPDGYIDHFLLVHAGEGEETGGGAEGENAIWSHRAFAFSTLQGSVGPSGNLHGGVEIGHTGIWVGDYTMQPENGGLGVFAHEFGHDLELPDEYDRSGDNSTGFWTLMSSGSYLGDGTVDIGSRPGDLNAWDKLQLGWLDVANAISGTTATFTLGPAEYNSEVPQALLVSLPNRQRALDLAPPVEGDLAWWSGKGNELDNSMVHPVDVPEGNASLELQLWYDIEEGWDYAYVSVSVDAGASWEHLASNVTTTDDPNAQNEGNGITGTSGDWVPASFDLSPYAGQSVLVQVRYWTDAAVEGKGLLVDASTLTGGGLDEPLEDWTPSGFTETTGIEILSTVQAYIAENRQYLSYDEGLRTGPYHFGFESTKPNWVEHYPYQNGLLISYWDDFYTDNDVSQHPGEGMILPIDAHPEPLLQPDGLPWSPRIQSYDSPFGLERTDALTLHLDGVESVLPSIPGVPVFDDLRSYYIPGDAAAEWSAWASVSVPPTGTQIVVLGSNGNLVDVRVQPSLN